MEELVRNERWSELLRACKEAVQRAGVDKLPDEKMCALHAVALFHLGRTEECAWWLSRHSNNANQSSNYAVRFNLAAAQLVSARTANNRLLLNGAVATVFRRLANESDNDNDPASESENGRRNRNREAALCNLAVAHLAGGDVAAATHALEGLARALVLSRASSSSSSKRLKSGLDAVVVSDAVRLVRALGDAGGASFRSLLSTCYSMSGEAEAARLLMRPDGGGPNAPPPQRGLPAALQHWSAGSLEECVAALEGESSCEASELLGTALLRLGRCEEAIGPLRRAAATSVGALYNLVVALGRARRPAEDELVGMALLVPLLRRESDDGPERRRVLGRVLARQGLLLAAGGRLDEAVAAFGEAVRACPMDAHVATADAHAECLMRLGRFDDALQLLAGVPPDSSRRFNARLECLLRVGRLDELLEATDAWVERLSDPALLCNAAIVMLTHHHVARAASLLRRARELDPSSLHAAYSLAVFLLGQGRDDEACSLWTSFRRLFPEPGRSTEQLRQARAQELAALGAAASPGEGDVIYARVPEADALRLDVAVLTASSDKDAVLAALQSL